VSFDHQPVVVFTEGSYYPEDFSVSIFPILGERFELRRTEALTPDELIEALAEADVVVARRGQFIARVFQALPRLKGIVKWGAGVETIDIPAATKSGIIVANSPGNSFAVAEAAMCLMLAVAKYLLVMVQAAKDGERPAFDVRGNELYEKTLGIIGFGRIGRHLAHIAQGFAMNVIAFDPYVPAGIFPDVGARQVDLPTLMQESDYISIHCALTPETRHLIGEKEISLMKSSAYLVNTARGPVLEETALYRALVEGRIAGAGLDVFEFEPLDPNNPLLALPNVVATPHSLPRAWESTGRTTRMIQNAVLAIIDGHLPDTVLNPNLKIQGAQP
jgi:D-3-phosphoglycerate dehydrogenase